MFDFSYLGGMAPCPALHHLGWPWLGAPLLRWLPLWVPDAYSQSSSPPLRVALALHLPTQLTTIEVGPGWGTFSLPFTISPTLLPPLWPPRPLESKVIQIQSDHPPAFSPPVAAMERSKVICSIQVWGRAVGLSSKVSLDFAGLGSPCSSTPLLFLLLDVALYTDDLLTFEMDKSTWWLKRVWFPSSAPPSLFFRARLGCFLKALLSLLPHFSFLHVLLLSPKFLLGGYCMHRRWLSRCLLTGCHWLCLWLPTFWTSFLQWSGWASLLAGEELLRGIWVSARCMPSSSVSRGFTKSWVGQVALRSPINRHALDLTVSLDDQGQ